MLKVGKSDESQRNMGRMFSDMEISLALQAEIDQGVASASTLGGISAPEVLSALESEPDRSKNIEYF